MGEGQVLVADQLLVEGHPGLAPEGGEQVLGGALARAERVGGQARPLHVAHGEDLRVAGATGRVGLDPGRAAHRDHLHRLGQEGQIGHVADGDDHRLRRQQRTIGADQPFGRDLAGHERPAEGGAERLGRSPLFAERQRLLDVHQHHLLRAQPVGLGGHVAADVACADDHHLLARGHGLVTLGRLEVVERRDHPLVAGEGKGARLVRAHGHDHVVELTLERLHPLAAQGLVQMHVQVLGLQETVDLRVPHRLRQPLPGDGLGEFAAQPRAALIDVRLHPVQGQVPGHGHARRAAADDRHLVARGRQGSGRVHVAHRAAEHRGVDGVVDLLARTVLDAQVRADGAAHRGRQRRVAQEHLVGFVGAALADEPQPVDGGDVDGAEEGAGRGRIAVGPEGFAPAQITALDHPDQVALEPRGQVAQRVAAAEAFVPDAAAEFGHGHGPGEHQGPLLRSDGGEQLPLVALGEGGQQFRPADARQEFGQPVQQPLPLGVVRPGELGVGGRIGTVGGAAEVDLAAHHAHAGPIAKHVVRVLRLHPADHADAAAVELGEGVAHRAEHPHLGPLVVRVPLGHGQAAGADGAADHHPAAGHGVAHAVGGVALDDDVRADIQVADVVRGRALADDGRAGLAHAAEPLAHRAGDAQGERPLGTAEAQADVVLAEGLEQEVIGRFRRSAHRGLEVLGGDPLVGRVPAGNGATALPGFVHGGVL